MEEPNKFSNQSPTNKNPSNQSEQSTSGTQEQNVEELVNQALERKQSLQYLSQLRGRVNWLTGLFAIAVIILGGGLGWVSYSLQQQKEQFVQQNEIPENLERIQELDTQIQQLQEKVPDSQRIERLENQIDELKAAIENNQQQLESVSRENQNQALQEESPQEESPQESSE
ncbi:MAG: hypothetical protein BRC33_07160 [Cyanobacteria bacterium SW_9_44_58]|nr:MAG: hypothetical protein BRC33_07160 [Cyanobacteria bacterium SW_9_44_58]